MSSVLGLIMLDETVVGVALPTIQEEFGMSAVLSGWVVNSYLLVFSCLVALAGRLGDTIGLKVVSITGLGIFGVASLISGLAPDGTWLITARAIQGIGAAAIFPTSLAIITTVFPQDERGLALGIYGSVGGMFLVFGPLFSGLLSAYASWRWIFWINLPLVVSVARVLWVWDAPPPPTVSARVDYKGALTLALGLCAIVFAIMQGPVWEWSTLAFMILPVSGVSLLVSFVFIELRTSGEPLLDLRLFQKPTFIGSILAIFVAQFSKIAVIVFVPEYLQETLEIGPFRSGLTLLSAMAPVPVAGIAVACLLDRLGVRWFSLWGLLMLSVSLSWVAFAIFWGDTWPLSPALIVWGVGLSFVFAPPRKAIFDAVPISQRGQSSGIVFSAQLLGGTFGMAICTSLLAITQAPWVVFLVPSLAGFAALTLCWFSVDYDDATQSGA